ncbi:hypothetical protein, partial [Rubrimonas sp.]|uniref:hypothetical protein n=1 Tax=Rubrimonas sp. TaxID=2036015 RepID=UPI002FDD02BF
HKLLTDWARQGILQLCRWLPGREIVFVGDSSFAVHELAHAVDCRATLISRLHLARGEEPHVGDGGEQPPGLHVRR